MKTYILTARRYPWLLVPVEVALGALESGPIQNVSRLFRSLRTSSGRPISGDEILLSLNALCDLGILERKGKGHLFHKERLAATAGLREGIRVALDVVDEGIAAGRPEAQLCVSLPPIMSMATQDVIRESSMDLRSSLVDIIAGARHSLIVASPFWDAHTLGEMVSLVDTKLSNGVQMSLLGRFARDLPEGVRTELRRIASKNQCAILSWIEGTGADTQTFHFKAASADGGRRAYVGSANMTFSSLRSRMELGVILGGAAAKQLDRILRIVITIASSMEV